MLQIKLGVELATLGLSFRKGLLTARELGADAVEIDARNELQAEDLSRTGVRQIRKTLNDLNLRVSAVAFRTRRGYDVQDDLEARIDATKRVMSTAYELGASVVVNHVGRVPTDWQSAAASSLVQALTDLGRHGQKVGALLLAETGTESGEELAGLIGRLPPGSLGVDFNPANLIVQGHSPTAAMTALAPHVMHLHATDATRDVAQGRGVEVPLGQGNAEIPELLGMLEEQQYRGFITVVRRQSNSPLSDVQQALHFLRNL